MDTINNFNMTPEQWPYGSTRIIVLSNTLKEPPKNLTGKIEIYSGDISELLNTLEKDGHKHAYIDGGTTIQTFLNLKKINEMTITLIPILLGEGISLFGKVNQDIHLTQAKAIACENDFIQIQYKVQYN